MQRGKQFDSMPLQISTDSRKKFEKNPGSSRSTRDRPEYKLEKSVSSKKMKSDETLEITNRFDPSPSNSRSSKNAEELALNCASSIAPNGSEESFSGRERLKRHRVEAAGRVWIPEMWGKEDLLKDWTDSTVFDSCVANSSILSARAALIEESRRVDATRIRIENS